MKKIYVLVMLLLLFIGCQDSNGSGAATNNNNAAATNMGTNNAASSSPTPTNTPTNTSAQNSGQVSSPNPTSKENPTSAMARLPVIEVGRVLPEVPTKDFVGQPFTIASRGDKQGQLITVFAPGCPVCHATIPRWITIYSQFFQPRGIPVMAISVQNEGDTAHVIDELKIPFHVSVMPDVDLKFGCRIPDVPTTLAIGPDGTIKGMWVGRPNAAQLTEILKAFCPECTINVTQQS